MFDSPSPSGTLPARARGGGHEADVRDDDGDWHDGHSEEGRRLVEQAGVVVFGAGVDRIGNGTAAQRCHDPQRGR